MLPFREILLIVLRDLKGPWAQELEHFREGQELEHIREILVGLWGLSLGPRL